MHMHYDYTLHMNHAHSHTVHYVTHSMLIIIGYHAYTQIKAPTLLYTEPSILIVVQAEINFSNQNLNMSSLIVKVQSL